jgi:hypothetical protein
MLRALSLVLLVPLATSCAHTNAMARQPGMPRVSSSPAEWSSIRTLRSGSSIAVTLFNGELVRGQLVAADDEHVVVASSNATTEFMRLAVRRVTLFTAGTRGTQAKRGFLVGAVAGALVAGLTVESNRAPWMLMLSGGWGALGALFGALGGSSPEGTIIYEHAPPGHAERDEPLANRRLQPTAAPRAVSRRG